MYLPLDESSKCFECHPLVILHELRKLFAKGVGQKSNVLSLLLLCKGLKDNMQIY